MPLPLITRRPCSPSFNLEETLPPLVCQGLTFQEFQDTSVQRFLQSYWWPSLGVEELTLLLAGRLPAFSVITPAPWVLPWFHILAPGGRSHGRRLLKALGLCNKEEGCQSLMAGDICKKQQDNIKQLRSDGFLLHPMFSAILLYRI